jgi:hypothetical protein
MIWVLKECLTHSLNDDRAYVPHCIYIDIYVFNIVEMMVQKASIFEI